MFSNKKPALESSAVSFRHAVFPTRIPGRAVDLAPAYPATSRPPRPPQHPVSQVPTTESDFIEWIFSKAGVSAAAYKQETLARRIPPCLRALKATSMTDARFRICRDPDQLRVAMDAMLIGVTSFFRDPAIFAGLCANVLPELVNTPHLRVWSAGCSNGSELYSVAMLLAELELLPRAELLGTDCRIEAITQARQGIFDGRAVDELPEHLRTGYFAQRSAEEWQISDPLRRSVQWRQSNVLEAPESSSWDLIFCRNLAIYLQPAAASALWDRLASALRPGGVLVLGRAERPAASRLLSNIGPCLYRRDKG